DQSWSAMRSSAIWRAAWANVAKSLPTGCFASSPISTSRRTAHCCCFGFCYWDFLGRGAPDDVNILVRVKLTNPKVFLSMVHENGIAPFEHVRDCLFCLLNLVRFVGVESELEIAIAGVEDVDDGNALFAFLHSGV